LIEHKTYQETLQENKSRFTLIEKQKTCYLFVVCPRRFPSWSESM
jgi:dolichyl-phosphate-mannose--protein O-mannosyl transferase